MCTRKIPEILSGCRGHYAANLKRELPRIPYAPAFAESARTGERLMDIHIHYEQQPEHPLHRHETGHLNWRVEKMKLNKDKTELRYNEFLTFTKIPPEVYEYKLGNPQRLRVGNRPIPNLDRYPLRHKG